MRRGRVVLLLGAAALAGLVVGGSVRGADEPPPNAAPTFKQYCVQCHGGKTPMAGVNLELLTGQPMAADTFPVWERVAAALEQHRMPPKGMPQLTDEQRTQAVAWVHAELKAFAGKNAGDPGRVTVRRLTSGEYDYVVQDLTGVDLDVGIDGSTDSVGGEGFTNFGDVQFVQDATLERYLEAAKNVAEHAVIGAGPIEFYTDPGKTGFEMSAINRIKRIYEANGIRTVSGEGGKPFGLEKYGKALYVAWQFQHRASLGEPNAALKDLAAREGISARFAQHIWNVVNSRSLGYPSNEVVARWQKLPASAAAARAECADIQKFMVTWPSWLFSRGDVAAGGAGDESPLIFNDKSLAVQATHHFVFNRGGRGGGGRAQAPQPGPARFFLNVASVNPAATGKPVVIWRNPTIAYRRGGPGRGTAPGAQPPVAQPPASQPSAAQPAATAQTAAANPADAQAGGGLNAGALRRGPPAGPKQPLRSMVSEEAAKKLAFGQSPDGSQIGPDDFASEGSVSFEVPVPDGVFAVELQVDAEIGAARDQVFRIVITDREDGSTRGIPTRALLGDPKSEGFRAFKTGVLEFARLWPPNTHSEPTPADKDPIPDPFDSTYNVPEHDEFDNKVKYVRDDRYVYENMLDDATRKRLDNAWNDLYASFSYHDNYLQMIAAHYKIDMKGKTIADMDPAALAAMPAEARQYMQPLVAKYKEVQAAQAAARPRHVADCLEFASRAWRRPLTEKEKQSLRTFYDKAVTSEGDHTKAIRALLARILVSPAFLYRVEQPAQGAAASVKPIPDWEMASRLSFFLWASIPDEELRRAAGAGELSTPEGLQRQVKRMLADAKARRFSAEFFGQWLGFYHFDQFKGVDTTRYPEFTNEVKDSMYDEAVSFFEHIIRKDRPVRDILSADYTFLNQPLAKFYGIKKEMKSKSEVELVEGASALQRGGLLRLGAVLTATSAPLRTSPVKRGDWVLRRIMGIAVPPPPADAGSIPADDKLFGGLSLKQKLEAHKRNATCANCHARIDPIGFSLEHYDSTGRWREKYADGKPIEDSGVTTDKIEISGVSGLLDYLKSKDDQVRRTLSRKLIGYALGRTIQPSDTPLIDRMVAAGSDATFSQLVGEVVASRQFRNRLGREAGTAVAVARSSDKVGKQ